jgi:hypothetical protein
MYGTTAFTHTGLIFTSLGNEWMETATGWKPGPWQTLTIFTAQGWSGTARWREELDGIRCQANISGGTSGNLLQLPPEWALRNTYYGTLYTSSGPRGFTVGGTGSTRTFRMQPADNPNYVRLDCFISSYYF